jgi:putative nucleotidyltransferase with HDIG domain
MTAKLYDIDALLEEVVTLPSMPDSLAKITDLVNDPACALKDVAQAISADPSIALKTLRLVNSAYYGLGQEVSTMEHAVVLLGVKVIKNLALTATVFDTVKGGAEDLLYHSVSCGVSMRMLAEAGVLGDQVETADEAFVFGLLHDIGKVILAEYMPDEYEEVPALAQDRGITWSQAEIELIGVDHAELGARLAKQWKLSPPIVNAIAGHHDLSKSEEPFRRISATLSIADYLSILSGFTSNDLAPVAPPLEAWELSGLNSSLTAGVTERYFESLQDMGELLKLA